MKYNNELLLKIAQGDAFGLAVEYAASSHENFKKLLQFDHYYSHPLGIKAGSYSDDTQMSIAVAEVIIDGPPYTQEKFGRAFFNAYKRDPVCGYSGFLQSVLRTSSTYEEFISRIVPTSDKNGAAMRAVPIGVIKDPYEVMNVAEIQASVTHNTKSGLFTSTAVALASHYALYDYGSFKDMKKWFEKYLPTSGVLFEPYDKQISVCEPYVAMRTVHAVFDALITKTTLQDILCHLIEIKGDTDSTCSIAMGIASSKLTDSLPAFFETELAPNNKCGVSFLRDLSVKLIDPWYQRDLK